MKDSLIVEFNVCESSTVLATVELSQTEIEKFYLEKYKNNNILNPDKIYRSQISAINASKFLSIEFNITIELDITSEFKTKRDVFIGIDYNKNAIYEYNTIYLKTVKTFIITETDLNNIALFKYLNRQTETNYSISIISIKTKQIEIPK